MKVAFPLIQSASWTGGYNYLLNLFRSIQKYQGDQITPTLFCGEDALESDLQPFYEMPGLEIVRSSLFDADMKALRLLRSMLTGLDSGALHLFRQYNIDAVFENAIFFGWRFPIPAIAWLPDFQHRQMRDQFGFGAYWRRELGFRAQIASGSMIMLSSENSRKDCEHFYPAAVGNTAVVRFAAPIPAELIEDSPETVIREYQLPPHFFYLPNQFWKHKNHIVVIEALGLLKRQGCEVVVAVTGNPRDPRHPEYFGYLNTRVESLGLQDNFRVLGMVPRRHVISLMRVCTALINPSHFEGWSSTVEEARTLGVPMLLSDIAVHREQMGDGATYFDPDDASALAAKLREAGTETTFSTETRRPGAQGDEYVSRFAGDFVAVVRRAVGSTGKV
jgi:glycosyltransferase involved in cell wall biosynthesis